MMEPVVNTSLDPLCDDHHHYSLILINDTYNYDVDKMFALVFDDCPVQQTLSEERFRSDVVWNPWQLEADGFQRREVTYVVTVPHQSKPFLFAEKQALHPDSKPGSFYLVDAECLSSNVPYADSFSVVERCYISQVEDDKCHLCISCEINFIKSLWGPVKGLITDITIENITKHFEALEILLRKEDPTYELSDSDDPGTAAAGTELEVEVISEFFDDESFYFTGIVYFAFTCSIFCLVCITGVLSYGLWNSLDRMSFMSTRILDKQRRTHNYSQPSVHTIADDLVQHLSELLASATRLIETTTESLEELTERESKLGKQEKPEVEVEVEVVVVKKEDDAEEDEEEYAEEKV